MVFEKNFSFVVDTEEVGKTKEVPLNIPPLDAGTHTLQMTIDNMYWVNNEDKLILAMIAFRLEVLHTLVFGLQQYDSINVKTGQSGRHSFLSCTSSDAWILQFYLNRDWIVSAEIVGTDTLCGWEIRTRQSLSKVILRDAEGCDGTVVVPTRKTGVNGSSIVGCKQAAASRWQH